MTRIGTMVVAVLCGCATQPEATTRASTPARPETAATPTTSPAPRDAGVDAGEDAGFDEAAEMEAAASLPLPPVDVGCSVLPRVCARGACDANAISTRRALRVQRGPVSYYGDQFHGRRTANGERYDKRALSAASRTLPFGAIVRVRRIDDPERITIVRINDRGPFGRRGRILDLSRAAAECIGMIRAGVVEVRAEVLDWGPNGRP